MKKEINLARIAVILLFAMTFLLVGVTAPALHATYVPEDQIINVHSYEAQDTTINSEVHYICFNRTISQDRSADMIMEMYMVNDEGSRIEIESNKFENFFEAGTERVVTPRPLPEAEIVPGTYKYVAIAEIDMANGMVTRTVTFTSGSFSIERGPAKDITRPITC